MNRNVAATTLMMRLKRRLQKLGFRFEAEFAALAALRSPAVLGGMFVLTMSLALDVIAQAGFVPLQFTGLDFLGFVVHELGHLAFRLAGTTLSVMMGTGFQWLLPAGAIAMFLKQRDGAAACYALCWLALSLNDSVSYIADARTQAGDMSLSLRFWSMVDGREVGANETIHDWNYMLGGLGLLAWDQWIAGLVRAIAIVISLVAVGLAGYLLWTSLRGPRVRRPLRRSP